MKTCLIILPLFLAISTDAASRGYLPTVGPAPIRFEESKGSPHERAIMRPYPLPLLNPDPAPGAETKSATAVSPEAPMPHPDATAREIESESAAPSEPEPPQANQDLIMKIVVLDRENEQARLRLGLLPPSQVPAAQRQRPHFVADLYRRHQTRIPEPSTPP